MAICVGDRVDGLAEVGDEVERPRDPAVNHVGRAGEHQRPERPDVVVGLVEIDDERDEQQTEDAQHIRQREDAVGVDTLVGFHGFSFFFGHCGASSFRRLPRRSLLLPIL